MKKLLLCLSILLLALNLPAQTPEEYVKLGDDFYNKEQFKEAVLSYEKALESRGSFKESSLAYLLYSLAWAYRDQGLASSAEPFFIEAKNSYEKASGKEHSDYIRATHDLSTLYKDMGNFEKAEPLYLEVKNLREKLLGKAHPDYEKSCSGLAGLYYSQGLYDKAEPLFIETKNLREKSVGKEHANYIYSCYILATLYKDQGRYDKAEPLFLEEKKLEAKTLGKEHQDYAATCNSLGEVYYFQGLYSKAEPLFIEAKEIRAKILGREHSDYLSCSNNLANLLSDQGFYTEAEILYVECRDICEKTLGKDHPNYISSCNNLAILYLDQGLYSKAEPLFVEAKNTRERVSGVDDPAYANSCNNLGNLYYKQGRYDKAEPLYLTAKSIREKKLGKQHKLYASTCSNLALLYSKQSLFRKAEPMALEAKNIREKLVGKNHPDYANSCNNVALLYSSQEQYDKAGDLYKEAKDIYEKEYGSDHADYAMCCYNLALLYTYQGMYQKADPFYKKMISNKLKQIDELLPTFSERERDEFYKSITHYFSAYYSYVATVKQPALYGELFNLQLKIKGLIFQSTQKMQSQLLNSGNPALVQKYEDWKTKRIQLNNYLQLPIGERANRKLNVDSLNTVINNLERAISTESELFASATSKKKYTWQEVQKKLLPEEAAVEIIRTDSSYLVLIVKPTTVGNPEAIIFTNGKEMDTRFIRYYRNCIATKITDELSYQNFWLPIQEKLGKTKKVYVSADGVYHQLNLLTLRNPASQNYLLQETTIQLVSNLKDLLTVKKQDLPQNYEHYKIHLIAYPKYDGGNTSTKKDVLPLNTGLKSDTSQRFYDRGGKISMLPGTKVEAGNIGALCARLNIKSEIRLMEDASESYLKSLRNPSIVHIATHGFFIPTEEANKNTRGISNEEIRGYTRDPLHNSGLLLANAQQGMSGLITEGEDGVLTAKEALNLTLDKTDLVIMSACETGLGEIRNGEGVYGLQRSFQQAGAKTVIISLWKVSDEATQELMSNFYNNLLAKKLPKREAFKQAQASLLLKYPEPYYWGAFVMIGE